ncbi:MAG: hypothetical protein ACI4SO_01080 [Muribaculaceae bacterium]
MKKLVLSLAVLAGMTMVACGSSENNAEAADAAAVEAPVEAPAEAAAPCCGDTDSVAAEAPAAEAPAPAAEEAK